MGWPVGGPTEVFCDNTGAVGLAHSAASNKRARHYDVAVNAIKDWVQRGIIEVSIVSTTEQPADFLTKALTVEDFEKWRCRIMGSD